MPFKCQASPVYTAPAQRSPRSAFEACTLGCFWKGPISHYFISFVTNLILCSFCLVVLIFTFRFVTVVKLTFVTEFHASRSALAYTVVSPATSRAQSRSNASREQNLGATATTLSYSKLGYANARWPL